MTRRLLESDALKRRAIELGVNIASRVVIRLPEERKFIVDKEVSLTAYEEFASSDDDTTRAAALKRHLDSVKGRIGVL